LARNVKFLERGIAAAEVHYTHRALRTIFSLRKRLQPEVLVEAISAYASKSNQQNISDALNSAAESLGLKLAAGPSAKLCEPEVCLFFCLLAQLYLLDHGEHEKGARLSDVLVGAALGLQRRTLDPIASRVFFYYSRFFEVAGRLADARPMLLKALQTATLSNMKETKAMGLTLLLRNFLHYKLYDQAERLAAKSSFPTDAPNNLLARYLYYMGRIEAVQLNYSQAQMHLLEATRKAPSTSATAGFQQTVHKIYVIVELLMGNIPERSLFRLPVLRKPLQPYFELAQAVRVGDLSQFQDVVSR
ncbi:26S proteasome non-ATPase regulatory subunit, partial [Coemansia thaxteri]